MRNSMLKLVTCQKTQRRVSMSDIKQLKQTAHSKNNIKSLAGHAEHSYELDLSSLVIKAMSFSKTPHLEQQKYAFRPIGDNIRLK